MLYLAPFEAERSPLWQKESRDFRSGMLWSEGFYLSIAKGYGFIRTSTGEDILFSSYDIPKNVWKKISVGDYVEFTVGENKNTSNFVVAKNAIITKKMPRQLAITMPNHDKLEVRHIYQYGRNSLLKDGYGDFYPDYAPESFDYVFVKTSKRTFMFNRCGSPVVFDGEADIDNFYEYLVDLLLKYDICRDYTDSF